MHITLEGAARIARHQHSWRHWWHRFYHPGRWVAALAGVMISEALAGLRVLSTSCADYCCYSAAAISRKHVSDTPSRIDWQGRWITGSGTGLPAVFHLAGARAPLAAWVMQLMLLAVLHRAALWHVPQCPTPAASGKTTSAATATARNFRGWFSILAGLLFSALVRIPVLHGADDAKA